MILTEEILLLQKRAGIITEAEYKEKLAEVNINLDDKEQAVVDDVKDEMSDILKTMDTEFEKASKSTNEGVITIASIAIALPAIMGLIAKFGKAAGTMISKMLGNKPNDDAAYQQWMRELNVSQSYSEPTGRLNARDMNNQYNFKNFKLNDK
jgi:hypothetical protein